MNTPYKASQHLATLRSVGKGVRLSTPNAFGDSPNNANWAAFDVPSASLRAFEDACKELNLYTGWFGEADYVHSGVSCMVVAKYVRDKIFRS